MKNPVKLACKQLPKYGAKVLHETSKGVLFLLPNGGRWFVTKRTPLRVVREVIDDSYLIALGLQRFTQTVNPEIAPERLRMTAHFLERLNLMNSQAGVTVREVHEVLAKPKKVLATSNLSRLIVIGERVSPLIAQDDGDLVLVTLRWSTVELWDKYPRPEKGSEDDRNIDAEAGVCPSP